MTKAIRESEELDDDVFLMYSHVEGVYYLKRYSMEADDGIQYSEVDFDTAEEAREAYEADVVVWL